MNISIRTIIFLCIIILCNIFLFHTGMSQTRYEYFRKFISKFKMISYPYNISNDGCYSKEIKEDQQIDIYEDSMFFNASHVPRIAIGILPDTMDFYVVIYGTASACYLIGIAVYSKNGQLLDTKELSKGCGAGIGYLCHEFLCINSFNRIYMLHIEGYCDSKVAFEINKVIIKNGYIKVKGRKKYILLKD